MPDRIGELASMEGYSPQEADFQFGVRATPWFGEFAQQHGEPNLNDPNYDYRAAWAAGARPNVRDPGDNQYHWPSQFKGAEHPNRIVNGIDTITGQPMPSASNWMLGETAALGDYIPTKPTNMLGDIAQGIVDYAKRPGQTMAPNPHSPGSEEHQFFEDQRRSNTYRIGPEAGFDIVTGGMGVAPRGALGMAGGKMVTPGALAAVDEYRPPFYSAVEQAVQGARQNAAPGQQWAGFLRNQPGVKPEEVEALGLGKLFEQPGAIPKQAVLGEIAANRVNVGEVVKGDLLAHDIGAQRIEPIGQHGLQYLRTSQDIADAARHNPQFRESIKGMSEADIFAAAERLREAQKYTPTKFSQYTLPGGENYREMLLTLPEGGTVINRMKDIQRRLGEINELPAAVHQGPEGPKILAEFDALQSEKARLKHEIPPTFKSGHYDEPNILAHVRYNDRVIDGKKTLFVEEVQSDWHQKGKKQGYTSDQPLQWSEPRVISSDGTKMWSATDRNGYEYKVRQDPDGNFHGIAQNVNATPQGASSLQEAQTAAERYISQRGGGTVPDAPFKTTWPELAMKRIIREAAEKGYDKVAWTPGSVQAERYDLSKHVDGIRWEPTISTPDQRVVRIDPRDGKTINLQIDKSGTVVSSFPRSGGNQFEGRHLSDVIGKDIAEKIISGKEAGFLKDLDLKVGGEGMKGFYDEILPATVNKLVKKHGGRVGTGNLKADNAPEEVVQHWAAIDPEHPFVKKNRMPVHTLDITPSLRAQAMKGFPLFTAGGIAATGIMGEMARQDEYR